MAAARWLLPQVMLCWVRRVDTRLAPIALVSVAYAVLLALNVATLLTPPRLSLQLHVPAKGLPRIAWVLPGGTLWDRGVRVGDTLLIADGRLSRAVSRNDASPRRLVVRTRPGTVVAIDAGTLRQGHNTWPLLLLSPWFVLLGSLVALHASPAIGRATYGLFMSAACTLALAAAADNDDVLAMGAEWTSDALFAGFFVIFFLTFPAPRGTSLRRMLLFVPPLVGVVLGLASLRWSSLYDVAYLARMAVLLIYLLAGVGLLVSSFKRVREGDARRGLTIISAGTIASIAPFASLYLVPVLLHRSPLLSAETAILALALLPASFAYAILRHNVLNIQLLQRWLVHGLL